MPKKRFTREPGQPIPKEHLMAMANEDFAIMLGEELMDGNLSPAFVSEFNIMSSEAKQKAVEAFWNLKSLDNVYNIINADNLIKSFYKDFFLEYPEMADLINHSIRGRN